MTAWLVTVMLAVTVTHAAVVVVPGRGPIVSGSIAAEEQTKYYVVGEARDGQRETLFSIAAATLGNGNRYPEIFALNRDRVQPDGERLTDPLVIKPGWVLQLPAGATGAGVRVGPVPVFSAPTTAPQRGSAPDHDNAVDSGAATAGPDATRDELARLISVVVIVALLGLSLHLLLRGHRVGLPARARLAPRRPVGAAQRSSVAHLYPIALVGVGAKVGTGAQPGADGSLEPGTRLERSPSDSENGRHVAWPAAPLPAPPAARSAGRPALDRTEGSAVRRLSMLDTEVNDGGDSLAVSLTGLREWSGAAAHRWIGDGEPIRRTPGAVPVAVGIGPKGTLVVDLARAPDVITMTGPDDGLRRLACRLVEQLARVGIRASATVGAFDEPVPFGIHVLAGLDDPALADAPAGAHPQVVFSPGDPARGQGSQSRSIRRLVSRRSPIVVVILVGSLRRSRWSIDVRPGKP